MSTLHLPACIWDLFKVHLSRLKNLDLQVIQILFPTSFFANLSDGFITIIQDNQVIVPIKIGAVSAHAHHPPHKSNRSRLGPVDKYPYTVDYFALCSGAWNNVKYLNMHIKMTNSQREMTYS